MSPGRRRPRSTADPAAPAAIRRSVPEPAGVFATVAAAGEAVVGEVVPDEAVAALGEACGDARPPPRADPSDGTAAPPEVVAPAGDAVATNRRIADEAAAPEPESVDPPPTVDAAGAERRATSLAACDAVPAAVGPVPALAAASRRRAANPVGGCEVSSRRRTRMSPGAAGPGREPTDLGIAPPGATSRRTMAPSGGAATLPSDDHPARAADAPRAARVKSRRTTAPGAGAPAASNPNDRTPAPRATAPDAPRDAAPAAPVAALPDEAAPATIALETADAPPTVVAAGASPRVAPAVARPASGPATTSMTGLNAAALGDGAVPVVPATSAPAGAIARRSVGVTVPAEATAAPRGGVEGCPGRALRPAAWAAAAATADAAADVRAQARRSSPPRPAAAAGGGVAPKPVAVWTCAPRGTAPVDRCASPPPGAFPGPAPGGVDVCCTPAAGGTSLSPASRMEPAPATSFMRRTLTGAPRNADENPPGTWFSDVGARRAARRSPRAGRLDRSTRGAGSPPRAAPASGEADAADRGARAGGSTAAAAWVRAAITPAGSHHRGGAETGSRVRARMSTSAAICRRISTGRATPAANRRAADPTTPMPTMCGVRDDRLAASENRCAAARPSRVSAPAAAPARRSCMPPPPRGESAGAVMATSPASRCGSLRARVRVPRTARHCSSR